jgi:hypothetical protein
MRKNITANIRAIIITSVIVLLSSMAAALPWWFFVIPVLLFGTATTFLNWEVKGFLTGFIAGFIVWFGGNLYFDMTYTRVLYKIGLLLSVPGIIVLLAAGVIGGLLSALALHTGRTIVQWKADVYDENI